MKKLVTVLMLALFCFTVFISKSQEVKKDNEQKIFVYGGQINKAFIKYVMGLTEKTNPKICFLPTASADNDNYIIYWYELCHDLDMEPHVMNVWLGTYYQTKTFEEILLNMDALIVGGGNTLNMMAIWQAQGIDTVLHKALDKGIILAGGSAGSLCWFLNGTTDSRPKELSTVNGLGFLNYSHCPHYNSEETRRPLYHSKILSGEFKDGYACDDKAGILFINGKLVEAVSLDETNNSYYVGIKNNAIEEKIINSKIIQ